jgi:hypothetical protein
MSYPCVICQGPHTTGACLPKDFQTETITFTTSDGLLREFVTKVREWLACSPMSERISAKRCMELRAICDEYSEER